jgi:hypothetical protein
MVYRNKLSKKDKRSREKLLRMDLQMKMKTTMRMMRKKNKSPKIFSRLSKGSKKTLTSMKKMRMKI